MSIRVKNERDVAQSRISGSRPQQSMAMSCAGGDRLFVADKQESVTSFKYVSRPTSDMNGTKYQLMVELSEDGRLVAIASDEVSRSVTCLHKLDYGPCASSIMVPILCVLRRRTLNASKVPKTKGERDLKRIRRKWQLASCAHFLQVFRHQLPSKDISPYTAEDFTHSL